MQHNQNGSVSPLLISLVVTILLLIGVGAFGLWAFSGRQLYKTQTSQIVAGAVSSARQQEDNKLNESFAQAEKSPLQTYSGPQAYGSLVVNFPKTWSAYVDDSGNGQALVDGYFHPGVIPSLTDQHSIFSLRVEVVSEAYSQVLQQYQSNQQSGKDTVIPYKLPKVPSVIGVEVSGTLQDNKQGTMVILPLRNQTLQLWTESTQYLNDFNTLILPNFSFSP